MHTTAQTSLSIAMGQAHGQGFPEHGQTGTSPAELTTCNPTP